MKMHRRLGFTLLELLIAIGIICLLIQLALPAIENAREAARRTVCQNNLRELGLAVMHHHDAIGHYPTDGWGWSWLGDADRGFDAKQPGSWIFNILDFIEERNIRSMTTGKTGIEKAKAMRYLCATPIPLLVCPDRRPARAFKIGMTNPGLKTNDEFQLPITLGARSDYAINTGDWGRGEPAADFQLPKTLAEGDSPDFQWYDTSKYTGISFGRSGIRIRDVTDGTSKTYMIGEKCIEADRYLDGVDKGDNESMYSGFDNDNGRSAEYPAAQDGATQIPSAFGSCHAGFWNAVFCDGSIHSIPYTLDLEIHRRLANRQDGKNIEQF